MVHDHALCNRDLKWRRLPKICHPLQLRRLWFLRMRYLYPERRSSTFSRFPGARSSRLLHLTYMVGSRCPIRGRTTKWLSLHRDRAINSHRGHVVPSRGSFQTVQTCR